MIDIWSATGEKRSIRPLMATICRIIESQEQIATLSLVNNIYEQSILEELIETTKNPLHDDLNALHYLLKTPFRYPPLKHGSRFGTSFERGIFYGSLNTHTALAETAYYRFVYMLGPEVPYAGIITSEHTEFVVSVKSNLSIFLDESPFSFYESILISPNSYLETQQLGASMRQHGVEIFRYLSARDKKKGKNVGIFSPKAFISKEPITLTEWICQANIEEIGFLSKKDKRSFMFNQQYFWVDSFFPSPAV